MGGWGPGAETKRKVVDTGEGEGPIIISFLFGQDRGLIFKEILRNRLILTWG